MLFVEIRRRMSCLKNFFRILRNDSEVNKKNIFFMMVMSDIIMGRVLILGIYLRVLRMCF